MPVLGEGANWHELVILVKPRGWQPSPQEGLDWPVCGGTWPQAVRLLFPCPSKSQGGRLRGNIPPRRQGRWLRAHWRLLALDSLGVLRVRPHPIT